MGRMTEYFRYLNVKPRDLQDFKETMCYLDINDKMKKQRRKLKLYNNN